MMKKYELANQLRQRQHNGETAAIDTLSDDEIINSYVTCPRCGTREIGEEELRRAVMYATDADRFIKACALQDHCAGA